MKLGISNIAWDARSEEHTSELQSPAMISWVEIAPTKVWSAPDAADQIQIEAIRNSWAKDGFQIAALQSLLFGHPELTVFNGAEARGATEAYLRKIICLAGGLGAGALVFGSPKNRLVNGCPAREIEPIAHSFFRSMAERAVEVKTCFCLEPNPPAYGCDYVTTIAEALRVIREIDHPGLRLNLDTGILTMNGESPEDSIEEAFPWIGHVHVSEPQLAGVGSGGVDHRRIGRILKDLNYRGWVSIEMRAGGSQSNPAAVETALRTANEFYAG